MDNARNVLENRTLSELHIEYIVKRMAEGLPQRIILKYFKQDFVQDLPKTVDEDFDQWLYWKIDYYKHHQNVAQKWKDLYEAHRASFQQALMDKSYLASKVNRLTELEREYFAIDDTAPVKSVLVAYQQYKMLYERNTDAKVKVLEQVRKEVEGDRVRVEEWQMPPDALDELTDAEFEEFCDRVDRGEDARSALGDIQRRSAIRSNSNPEAET